MKPPPSLTFNIQETFIKDRPAAFGCLWLQQIRKGGEAVSLVDRSNKELFMMPLSNIRRHLYEHLSILQDNTGYLMTYIHRKYIYIYIRIYVYTQLKAHICSLIYTTNVPVAISACLLSNP